MSTLRPHLIQKIVPSEEKQQHHKNGVVVLESNLKKVEWVDQSKYPADLLKEIYKVHPIGHKQKEKNDRKAI